MSAGLSGACARLAPALAAFLSPALVAAAETPDAGHPVIQNIGVCLVGASLLGYAAKLVRQPPLLGYVLAGVAIGPFGLGLITSHTEIITLAEIGLILLLFMIGLEIDLKKMTAAGRWVIVPGVLQFPICAAAAYGSLVLLERAGLVIGSGSHARLYVAVAVALSSTMIVVKLLFEKTELDTLPGRITVGILVFQDLWAIVVLAVQPNLEAPELAGLARTFATGALLVGAALVASRYVLPRIFKAVAQLPELVLVLSLGWCFLVALVAAHPRVGLSMEMGALIAGVALATFPYNLDVVAKAISIRDFFITLFFVALGMRIPAPDLDVVLAALAVVGIVLVSRWLGVFGLLYPLAAGHRAALLATINLSQVSEFSLVIAALGVGLGHVAPDTLTLLIWVFALLAIASTYLVTYSHPLQVGVSRLLSRIGLRDLGVAPGDSHTGDARPFVLLGFFHIAGALFEQLRAKQPQVLSLMKVIDFNPRMKKRLEADGITFIYGDISHRDTLQHADIHEARVVACTIPDGVLKGTTNLKLLATLRSLCPAAKIIVTGDTPAQARELSAAGADYVLEPSRAAGERLAAVVEEALLAERAAQPGPGAPDPRAGRDPRA